MRAGLERQPGRASSPGRGRPFCLRCQPGAAEPPRAGAATGEGGGGGELLKPIACGGSRRPRAAPRWQERAGGRDGGTAAPAGPRPAVGPPSPAPAPVLMRPGRGLKRARRRPPAVQLRRGAGAGRRGRPRHGSPRWGGHAALC